MPSTVSTASPKSLVESLIAPVEVRQQEGGWFLDFGRAVFGTLIVPGGGVVNVWLGEACTTDGRLERSPKGCIRAVSLEQDRDALGPRLIIPADERNTGPAAVLMPKEIGEVYPFRYAEIIGDDLDPHACRQVFVHYPFDDDAAHFECSDPRLNAVWDICKYTIKATTFCGVYVDGDRERIPYEGDAYLNQLSHYCVDHEYELARHSHEYLLQHPTWPTEWQLYSVVMSWMDYLYSGERKSLEANYDLLVNKTLVTLARKDGLISAESPACDKAFEKSLNLWGERYIFSHGLRDLVDWPPGSFTDGGTGERDNHDMVPVNTVVNALHAYACRIMSKIAGRLGRADDMMRFTEHELKVKAALNKLMWDADRGVYLDGEGSTHASQHSNMFMLAFGLVPLERVASVAKFTKSRGMACSVYGSQFLLEALFNANEADAALELMTADHDRSWLHMIASGSTMTWEAWDWKYKNNLDWNHAWGAAPANIIPRCLMGVQPSSGFKKVTIKPRPGSLRHAKLKHPTPHGPILIELDNEPGQPMRLKLELPKGVEAIVVLPGKSGNDVPAFFNQLTGRHELTAY